MSPLDLWAKALNAAASARLLLGRGDGSGATSGAYYAMFNAARALLWLRDGIEPSDSKKHATTIRRFSERFVKTGLVPIELGRLLNEAAEARFIADYDEADVEAPVAKQRIEVMDRFLDALAKLKDQPQ
jgi:uncharacterized protein (UPF0332 family)